MCLSILSKRWNNGENEGTITGYQAKYKTYRGNYTGLIFKKPCLKKGKWHNRTRVTSKECSCYGETINDGVHRTYLAGFHIFGNLKDAKPWVSANNGRTLVKVEGRGIVAKGKQDRDDRGVTWVVRDIKVVGEVV